MINTWTARSVIMTLSGHTYTVREENQQNIIPGIYKTLINLYTQYLKLCEILQTQVL